MWRFNWADFGQVNKAVYEGAKAGLGAVKYINEHNHAK